jgi:hypothetical protein
MAATRRRKREARPGAAILGSRSALHVSTMATTHISSDTLDGPIAPSVGPLLAWYVDWRAGAICAEAFRRRDRRRRRAT